MRSGLVESVKKELRLPFCLAVVDVFEKWCLQEFGVSLYRYQHRVATALLMSLMVERKDVYAKISRQAGKTEIVTLILRFLIRMFIKLFGSPMRCAIASPKGEQAKTDIDRIKLTLKTLITRWHVEDRENNANTIRAFFRDQIIAEFFKFSLMPTTSNESKTLNIAVFEEAHKCDDTKRSDEIDPMLASTGGVSWFFGVGCIKECDFRKGCADELDDGVSIVVDCFEVFKDRRAVYEATGDPVHLEYEKKVKREIKKKGRMNPEIRRNYLLHDIVEIGDYISTKRLRSLRQPEGFKPDTETLFVGIDLAKKQDETVVTVINEYFDIVAWLVYSRVRYLDQIDLINEDLKSLELMDNILSVRLDSTREEAAFEAFIEKGELPVGEESGIIFSLLSKNRMYTALDQILFTDDDDPNVRLSYPAEHDHTEAFEHQMTNLQREYKGDNEYLSPHHKDEEGEHDDFPDSLALAVLAATESGFGGIIQSQSSAPESE